MALLERAYTEARYGPEEYTAEDAEEALTAARQLVSYVERRLRG